MDPSSTEKPGMRWRKHVEAARAYAAADDEDDRAFELARERLQARAIEYVTRRRPPRDE